MSKLKYLSTKYLKSIIDDKYSRGNFGEGKDYQDEIEEINNIYNNRVEKQEEARLASILAELEAFEQQREQSIALVSKIANLAISAILRDIDYITSDEKKLFIALNKYINRKGEE